MLNPFFRQKLLPESNKESVVSGTIHVCFYKQESTDKEKGLGFPGGAVVKNLPANAGDTGSSPGPGRSHMPRSS